MVSKNKEVQKALLSKIGVCGEWIQMAFTFSFIRIKTITFLLIFY